MKKRTKIYLWLSLLILGLLSFNLQLFVFEAPDGTLGFLLCLTSIVLMIASVIRMCQLSTRIHQFVVDILDLLSFI